MLTLTDGLAKGNVGARDIIHMAGGRVLQRAAAFRSIGFGHPLVKTDEGPLVS